MNAGLKPPAHDEAGGVHGGREVRKEQALKTPGLRQGRYPQRRLGDDAQRPLGPHEEVVEVRAGGRIGDRLCPNDFTVGQHHLHAQHHLGDLAVFRGERPRAPGRKEPADPADVLRLGKMVQGVADGIEPGLQLVADEAGLGRHRMVVGIDVDDPIERLDVHHDPAEQGQRAPASLGPSAYRGHGDPVGVGDPEDLRHVPGRLRPHHDIGQRRRAVRLPERAGVGDDRVP